MILEELYHDYRKEYIGARSHYGIGLGAAVE